MSSATRLSLIGYGRVGRALTAAAQQPVQIVKRGQSVAADEQGPVLICTTCDAIPEVYSKMPGNRRGDSVFMSNGMMLRFFVQQKIEHCTQVLLYMSADEDGTIQDGGQTAVTGKWAAEVQSFLTGAGLQCEILDTGAYTARMVEKLLWASVLWLVCHVHGGITVVRTLPNMQVGDALEAHRDELVQLVYELYPTIQLYALEAVPDYMEHYVDRPSTVEDVLSSVLSYSESVAHAVPSLDMARREFKWRNGFFMWRQPTPLHSQLLKRVGFDDLVREIEAAENGS